MRLFGVGGRPGIYMCLLLHEICTRGISLHFMTHTRAVRRNYFQQRELKHIFLRRLRTRKARDNIFFGIIRRGNKSVTLQTHTEFIVVLREDYQLFKVDAKRAH